jgi:hypothetical protein
MHDYGTATIVANDGGVAPAATLISRHWKFSHGLLEHAGYP